MSLSCCSISACRKYVNMHRHWYDRQYPLCLYIQSTNIKSLIYLQFFKVTPYLGYDHPLSSPLSVSFMLTLRPGVLADLSQCLFCPVEAFCKAYMQRKVMSPNDEQTSHQISTGLSRQRFLCISHFPPRCTLLQQFKLPRTSLFSGTPPWILRVK